MANPEHLALLQNGASAWNRWRRKNPGVEPDLSADGVSELDAEVVSLADIVVNEVMPGKAPASDGPLAALNLSKVNLRCANLVRCNLSRTVMILADLSGAKLQGANLSGAVLTSANLSKADLTDANFSGAVLRFAKLRQAKFGNAILRLANLDGIDGTKADFAQADLSVASLNDANLSRADLSGAFVYGVSAWNVELKGAVQRDLRITRTNEGVITVDDIKIAQFIYTLLNNKNVRDSIETLTTKLVLVLGRFTPARKRILDGIKQWLHDHNYVPILFDFDRPASRDFTETVVALAHLARFVVADLTEPASIPKELEAIVPRLAVPVQPLLQKGAPLYAMFSDYWKYDWVLELLRYRDLSQLLTIFQERVVDPAEREAKRLLVKRALALQRA
jgi:uncharacterized protein YjbI with pentapeptide repeats